MLCAVPSHDNYMYHLKTLGPTLMIICSCGLRPQRPRMCGAAVRVLHAEGKGGRAHRGIRCRQIDLQIDVFEASSHTHASTCTSGCARLSTSVCGSAFHHVATPAAALPCCGRRRRQLLRVGYSAPRRAQQACTRQQRWNGGMDPHQSGLEFRPKKK